MPPTASPQPAREERWLVVVSCKRDCRDSACSTVVVIVLSAKVEHAGRHDELIRAGDGGVQRDSIAQSDLVMFWSKDELLDERWKGDLMQDTLMRVRARLGNTLGIAEPESTGL